MESQLQLLVSAIPRDFYVTPDFWINFTIGIASMAFSALAYWEAKQAKLAAKHAGRSVKIQTVVLELTETSLKLDKVEPDIKYRTARDILSETSRRIRRFIAPFATDAELKDSIAKLEQSVSNALDALVQVRPITPSAEDQAPQAVYNAIEGHFSAITNDVANLIGLLEKQASNFGE